VVELAAAAVGATISAAFLSVNTQLRKGAERRDSLVRLTSSVEAINNRLEDLHNDLRSERVEIFSRLSAAEQKIARLEGSVKQP